MPTSESVAPRASSWSLAQLGLNDTATREEIRRRFMARLAECDFVPPSFEQLAASERLNVNGHLSPPAQIAVWAGESENLSLTVETFARTFFETKPDERTKAWTELYTRCSQHPHLLTRLRMLEPGLNSDVTIRDSAPDVVRTWTTNVVHAFVSPWIQRCTQLQSILADPKVHENHVKALREHCPGGAALLDIMAREFDLDPEDYKHLRKLGHLRQFPWIPNRWPMIFALVVCVIGVCITMAAVIASAGRGRSPQLRDREPTPNRISNPNDFRLPDNVVIQRLRDGSTRITTRKKDQVKLPAMQRDENSKSDLPP